MNETKHPLKSKTVWASLLQVVVAILVGTGVVNQAQGELLQDVGPETITSMVTAVLAVIALYGRVTAKTTLKAKQ